MLRGLDGLRCPGTVEQAANPADEALKRLEAECHHRVC